MLLILRGQQAAIGAICSMLLMEIARLHPNGSDKLGSMTAALQGYTDGMIAKRPDAESVLTQAMTFFIEQTSSLAEVLMEEHPESPQA